MVYLFQVGTSPDIQYLASGGSDDWMKGVAGIKWVFLFELPDKGHHGFLLPARNIVPVAQGVLVGVRTAALRIANTLV